MKHPDMIIAVIAAAAFVALAVVAFVAMATQRHLRGAQ
jgi:hypothetical protein